MRVTWEPADTDAVRPALAALVREQLISQGDQASPETIHERVRSLVGSGALVAWRSSRPVAWRTEHESWARPGYGEILTERT